MAENLTEKNTPKKKKEGLDIDGLKAWIEENRLKTRHWFMVEDLFHLKRGGRVTTVEAMIGSALKIKPILSLDEEGKLVVKSKARGTGKALDYLISRTEEEISDFSSMCFNIGNADAHEKAEKLKAMLIEKGANVVIGDSPGNLYNAAVLNRVYALAGLDRAEALGVTLNRDFSEKQASGKYVCSICGYVYDPAEHDGVAFEDLPEDWKCPRCKQGKDKFNKA